MFKVGDKVVVFLKGIKTSHIGTISEIDSYHCKVAYDTTIHTQNYSITFGWFEPEQITPFEIWDSPLSRALRD